MSEANGPGKFLLRWQEDELNEAETKVLKAFREGWKTGEGLVVEDGLMTCAVPPKDSSAPEKPSEGHTESDWRGAILRASFLRDLFLGNYGKFDPRLIEISRAWVEGRLDLNYCESRLPLAFSQCIFSDGISLRNAIIPELQLIGCEVRKSLFSPGLIRSLNAQGAQVSSSVFLVDGFKANGEVNLIGAEIGGGLHCRGIFKEGLNAESLKTSSDVFMNSVLVGGQVLAFESDGQVNLHGAEIGGQLICRGRFENGLSAQSLKTSSDVFMESVLDGGQVLAFESNGKVNLLGAEIGGHLICRGRFEKGLNARNLKTSSDVFMNSVLVDGQVLAFESNGEVNLIGAEIGGELHCRGIFKEGLNAANLKTSSDVFMESVLVDGQVLAFESNGQVNLHGAEIGGQLICRGRFEKGLNAQSLKTSSDVFMESVLVGGQVLAFESNGQVNLHDAEIGGQLICCGIFKEGLNAENLKTSSDVFMESVLVGGQVLAFESNGEVNLHGAEIGGQLNCRGIFKEGLYAQSLKTSSAVFMNSVQGDYVFLDDAEIGGNLDLGDSEIEDISLSNAEVHGALRNLRAWTRHLIGDAEGFCYQAIAPADDWKTGLDWVQSMTQGKTGFAPQPYEQLMSVYRRMGHSNWARNIGFELEKRRREDLKGWQWLTRRPWHGILKWTIGYGYKPFRFVPWALGLVAAGFLLFSSGHYWQAPAFLDNEWIPSEAEALESQFWKQDRKPPPDYLPFNPLVYSLEATFPVLPLGQLERWHPGNRFLLGVRWAWTLIGTLLLAFALFGAGVLGPRWRSSDESG